MVWIRKKNVSKETIYTYIYVFCKSELKKELISCLRFYKKSRRARSRGKDWKRQIPDILSISERPKEVEGRDTPRHWESDLIMGEKNQSAIATLVEWTTNYTIIIPLKNKDVHSVRKTMEIEFDNITLSLKSLLRMTEAKK